MFLPKVWDFSWWAFGTSKFPNLMAVVYRDFSYNGRWPYMVFHKGQVLDTKDFDCIKTHHSKSQREDKGNEDDFVIEANRSFLEACPKDALLYMDDVPC